MGVVSTCYYPIFFPVPKINNRYNDFQILGQEN